MKYATYILTTFGTEIENSFKTKKEMMSYLSNELFVTKKMESICVCTFKNDKYGNKDEYKTKYSFDNRF
jgi:hypothetical protein